MSSSAVEFNAPSSREFEVSIFGPAYGEGMALHLGDENWVIVDSCIDPGTSEPAALRYLRQIGVNPADSVRLVVATHWHDDHIRGLAKIFEVSRSARFACPAAIGKKEFLSLMAHYRRPCLIKHPGVSELNSIFLELERRAVSSGSNVRPEYGIERRELLALSLHGGGISTLQALSPSDAAHEKALIRLSEIIPKAGESKGKVLVDRPNHLAMALRVDALGQSIVLGSDLEVVSDSEDGWERITSIETGRPRVRLLKVPHHGSENAYSAGHWKNCMVPDAIAVLTPFVHGRVVLPTEAGLANLRANTSRVYLTASPERMIARIKERALADMLRKATIGPAISLGRAFGSITLRADVSDPAEWSITLRGSAVHLLEAGQISQVA